MLSRDHLKLHPLTTIGPPIVLTGILYLLQHTGPQGGLRDGQTLIPRTEETRCHIDSSVRNTCTFVKKYCTDFDDDGLIPYLRVYYCLSPTTRPYVLVCMLLWLMVLFSSMAIAAGDFLSVHLAVIVHILSISENLAGVTIFAFGNGSSDLFSTLSAMNSNSGSLTISELFGAAAFITTVVLGLIAIVQPFSVDPRTFVADVVWFMVAAAMLVTFLADGKLVLRECLGIIGLYIAFISFAILRAKSHGPPTGSAVSVTSSREQTDPVGATGDGTEHYDETSRLLDSSTDSISEFANLDTQSNQDNEIGSQVQTADNEESNRGQQIIDQTLKTTNTVTDESRANSSLDPTLLQNNADSISHTDDLPSCSFLEIFPPLHSWNRQSLGEKGLTTFSLPLLILIGLTTPIVGTTKDDEARSNNHIITYEDENVSESLNTSSQHVARSITSAQHSNPKKLQILTRNWQSYIQLILGPQFFTLVLLHQAFSSKLTSPTASITIHLVTLCFSITLILCSIITHPSNFPRLTITNNLLISITAFLISLTWIYLTATSAVTLLRTLGFILNIPPTILGATIFAIGNSSNDLAANVAVARKGLPVLAASACFGGPMMNMLLGIGCGGLVQVLKDDRGGHNPIGERSYSFDISYGLFLSAFSLLLGLGSTLTYAFYNSWRLDRRLGLGLIGIWAIFTTGNVVLSIVEI